MNIDQLQTVSPDDAEATWKDLKPSKLIIYFDLPKLCSYLSFADSNGIRWIQCCVKGEN